MKEPWLDSFLARCSPRERDVAELLMSWEWRGAEKVSNAALGRVLGVSRGRAAVLRDGVKRKMLLARRRAGEE